MKEKLKLIIVVLIAIIAVIPLTSVKAHNVELDSENHIVLPFNIIGGKGDIIINNSGSNYQLYWQAVETSNENYEKIKKISEDGSKNLESITTEREKLRKEEIDLANKLNEARENYTKKVNENAEDEEIKKAKEERDTAAKNYESKKEEFDKIDKEYKEKLAEIKKQEDALIPMYNENNWIKTNDGKINIDITQFSGKKIYIVWAKLVTSDGETLYNENIYEIEGSKKENNTINKNQDGENKKTETQPTTTNNDNTTAKGTLPRTGIDVYLSIILILTIGVAIILYKKNQKYKGVK